MSRLSENFGNLLGVGGVGFVCFGGVESKLVELVELPRLVYLVLPGCIETNFGRKSGEGELDNDLLFSFKLLGPSPSEELVGLFLLGRGLGYLEL